jgi:putative transposase
MLIHLHKQPATTLKVAAAKRLNVLLPVMRPNQVWAMDNPYIPMPPWFHLSGRRAELVHPPGLLWRVSISLEADFCNEDLE